MTERLADMLTGGAIAACFGYWFCCWWMNWWMSK
jgi:hypothetical protein